MAGKRQRALTDIEISEINAKLRYRGFDNLYPDQLYAAQKGGKNCSMLLEDLGNRIGIELPRTIKEEGHED